MRAVLTPEEQAALDEQVARLEQYERTEAEWLEVQTPEVQAAYALYVEDMGSDEPYASGESDTRHKWGE